MQCSAKGANAHTSKMYKTDFPAEFIAVAVKWGSQKCADFMKSGYRIANEEKYIKASSFLHAHSPESLANKLANLSN